MGADVRVLVVDEIVRRGLSPYLEGRSDVSVVGPAADVEAAVRLCRGDRIDVVLVDIDGPGPAGLEAIRRLRAECPQVKVMALSAFGATDLIVEALIAGASGYAQPSGGIEELVQMIRRAALGEMVMPAGNLVHVLDELHQNRPRAQIQQRALKNLTAREMEVLRELAACRDTAQIADALGISPLTVQTHVKNILAKLGVHSKVQAVTLALREGVVPIAQPA